MTLTGKVEAVLVGQAAQSLITTRQPEIALNFEGIVGDKHAGFTRRADGRVPHFPRGTLIRNERQVTLVSVEELAEVATALNVPEVLPEWLGANVLVSGIPRFTLLPIGARLFFANGAVLVVSGENEPCTGPGKVLQAHFPERIKSASQFPKAAIHKRGLLAVVELPGQLAAGESVRAKLPSQPAYSATD